MAGRGPAPSGNRQRERDNKPTTKVSRTTKLHGKPLPRADQVFPQWDWEDPEAERPATTDWHPQTVAWWDSMRRNPMCADIGPEGWAFLLDTALMHTIAWNEQKLNLFPEIRLRVAKFGVTPEDRARLGVTVTSGPVPGQGAAQLPNGVTEIGNARSRRDRLTAEA